MSGPVGSTHIFQLNSHRQAGRSLFAYRRRLAQVPGLRFCRLVFVGSMRSEGFNIGIVEPRRQMALCLWDHEQALDDFLERSPIGRSWQTETDQYCELRMRPFRSYGSYLGLDPLAGMEPATPPEGPVAMWTFANIPRQGLRYFWDQIRGASDRLITEPELVAGTAGPERFYRGAMTFTIWRRLESATRFAYHRKPHKQIVKDVKRRQLLTDSMFIRFSPYAVRGEWPAYSRFAGRFHAFATELTDKQRPNLLTSKLHHPAPPVNFD